MGQCGIPELVERVAHVIIFEVRTRCIPVTLGQHRLVSRTTIAATEAKPPTRLPATLHARGHHVFNYEACCSR